MTENRLKALDNGIFGYPFCPVTHLDVSRNHLTDVQNDALTSCYPLKFLDLRANRLNSTVFEAISMNQEIETLDISENPLAKLPYRAFGSLFKLNTLKIEESEIVDVDPNAFASLKQLHSLHISRNQLAIIKREFFQPLLGLLFLDLSNNPIRCTCAVKQTQDLLKEERVALIATATCSVDTPPGGALDIMQDDLEFLCQEQDEAPPPDECNIGFTDMSLSARYFTHSKNTLNVSVDIYTSSDIIYELCIHSNEEAKTIYRENHTEQHLETSLNISSGVIYSICVTLHPCGLRSCFSSSPLVDAGADLDRLLNLKAVVGIGTALAVCVTLFLLLLAYWIWQRQKRSKSEGGSSGDVDSTARSRASSVGSLGRRVTACSRSTGYPNSLQTSISVLSGETGLRQSLTTEDVLGAYEIIPSAARGVNQRGRSMSVPAVTFKPPKPRVRRFTRPSITNDLTPNVHHKLNEIHNRALQPKQPLSPHWDALLESPSDPHGNKTREQNLNKSLGTECVSNGSLAPGMNRNDVGVLDPSCNTPAANKSAVDGYLEAGPPLPTTENRPPLSVMLHEQCLNTGDERHHPPPGLKMLTISTLGSGKCTCSVSTAPSAVRGVVGCSCSRPGCYGSLKPRLAQEHSNTNRTCIPEGTYCNATKTGSTADTSVYVAENS